MNILGHHYFSQKHPETSQIKFKQNGTHDSSEDQPTLRMGVGSTAGARDGSPAVEGRPAAAKFQKLAEGKNPRVSSNLDGVRRRANPPRLAAAKAAADPKGPEVIPSDDDDKRGDKATSTMPMKPRKGDRTIPVGKTSSAGRTVSGKAAKLRLGAASNKTRAVTRAGMPTAMQLTGDDDNKDVNVAMAIERGLTMATALGNNRIISGPVPAGKTLSASKKAPGKAAKLRLGAASNKTRGVARAGMPTAMHLTRDDDDKDVDIATAIKRGLAMATALGNNLIISGPAPAGKTLSTSKKPPRKAAKLRIGAVSDGTRAVARAGMPMGAHLTTDDNNEDVDVAMASARGLAMRMALGNDRIIGGRVGANDRAVAGMPTGVPLMMDNNDEYIINVTAAGMVRPRSMAVATARGPATVTGGSAPTGEYLPALLGLVAEENSQGKTGQCGSAANFLPAQERQHKKEADIAHGVRGGTSGDSTAPGGNEEEDFDNTPKLLPHGMADLQPAMAVEGTTAFRFADVTNASDIADDWADEYGAFVANLYDEADVVAMALSPAARSQAYLAMLPNADTFVVLHGLHRWVTVPPS
jgi:hypothetical protein